jgi:hypothetical protein
MAPMSSQVRAKSRIHGHPSYTHTRQPAVKSEDEEPDDFLLDEEAHEDGALYKVRPQLSKPVTVLRPLKYLLGMKQRIEPIGALTVP